MKNLILLIILLLPAANSFAQDSFDPHLDDLSWNEFYKLQWDDFQGQPDKASAGEV